MGELPVGTGPFKLSEFAFLGNVRIERNEYYHDGAVMLDAVEFITDLEYQDYSSRLDAEMEAFGNGSLDAMVVGTQGLEMAGDRFSASTQAYPTRDVSEFLIFNTSISPFDDEHFRRSLVLASDVDSLAVATGRLRANGLVPPDLIDGDVGAVPLGFAPEQAMSELEAARVVNQEIDKSEIVFHAWVEGEFDDEFEEIASGWRRHLGIEAKYVSVPIADYTEIFDDGRVQMVVMAIAASFPSPSSIMNEVDLRLGGSRDVADDALVAIEMIEAASASADAVERERRYAEAEQYLIDKALVMPLFWYQSSLYHLLQPWVKDFRVPKYGGSKFSLVWFDDAALRSDQRQP